MCEDRFVASRCLFVEDHPLDPGVPDTCHSESEACVVIAVFLVAPPSSSGYHRLISSEAMNDWSPADSSNQTSSAGMASNSRQLEGIPRAATSSSKSASLSIRRASAFRSYDYGLRLASRALLLMHNYRSWRSVPLPP